MSVSHYRILLIVSLILGLVGVFLDDVFPQLLSPAFVAAQETQDTQLAETGTMALVLWIVATVALFIAGVASTVGLYLFRPWAPRLALITTILAFATVPALGIMGTVAQSGMATTFTGISNALWGAVLALVYFSPLKARFEKT